jgi:hypothetical protein
MKNVGLSAAVGPPSHKSVYAATVCNIFPKLDSCNCLIAPTHVTNSRFYKQFDCIVV